MIEKMWGKKKKKRERERERLGLSKQGLLVIVPASYLCLCAEYSRERQGQPIPSNRLYHNCVIGRLIE